MTTIRLRFTSEVGERIISTDDGTIVLSPGDEHDFDIELAKKLAQEGTFIAVNEGDWERKFDQKPIEDVSEDTDTGPAADRKR